jgi:hypothetical protein
LLLCAALGVVAAACIWSEPAFADEAAQEASSTLTWEQFRDKMGLTDEASIEDSPVGNSGGYPVNYLWTVIAGILVFWMQAGVSLIEAGFTRAKNAVNIFMKNVMDFSIGTLAFWAVGFGLMFGASTGYIGTTGFFMGGLGDSNWH